MIDDSLMDKFIEAEEIGEKDQALITQLEEIRESQKEELDGFLKTLSKAREILEGQGNEKGALAGLCRYCYGSNKTMVQKMDGYEGIQARKDEDIITILQCRHGQATENNFDF